MFASCLCLCSTSCAARYSREVVKMLLQRNEKQTKKHKDLGGCFAMRSFVI